MERDVLRRLLKIIVVAVSLLFAVVSIILDVYGYSILAIYFLVPLSIVAIVGTLWMCMVFFIPVSYIILVGIIDGIVDYVKNGRGDE